MSNQHNTTAPIAIGINFGPYHIKRELGEGAFGTVYEAIKQPLGKRVAIKILHAQWAANSQITERFIQEARAAASLRHPHIVDVDDVGERDGVPWIAMEFLEGESLASKLERDGSFSISTTLEYMLPILSAVAAIHDKGIIHRDLKPDNIQLWQGSAGNLHPKLLDFGIAKMKAETDSVTLTGATEIMGTPEYMAPEQWRSAKFVEPSSDQWALGVILYRLVTGVSPFKADSPQSVMFRVSMEATPRFEQELAVHQEFERALGRALEKDPAKRYPSVRALGAALWAFADVGVQQRWQSEFGGAKAGQEPPSQPLPTNLTTATPSSTGWMPSVPVASNSLVGTSHPIGNRKPRRTAVIGVVATLAAVGLVGIVAKVVAEPSSSSTLHSAPSTTHSEPSTNTLSTPRSSTTVPSGAASVPTVAPLAPAAFAILDSGVAAGPGALSTTTMAIPQALPSPARQPVQSTRPRTPTIRPTNPTPPVPTQHHAPAIGPLTSPNI